MLALELVSARLAVRVVLRSVRLVRRRRSWRSWLGTRTTYPFVRGRLAATVLSGVLTRRCSRCRSVDCRTRPRFSRSALNKAVAQTFGEDADKITPSVLNAAHRRIGGVMQDVENRNNIQFDPQLGQDLSGIVQNARMALPNRSLVLLGVRYRTCSAQSSQVLRSAVRVMGT